jgi:PTH2 family peptidyl-tRNA hydrolase
MSFKMVILVREDLKLPKGKLAAQVAHAAVEAALNSPKLRLSAWREEGQKKVVLKVKDKEELLGFFNKAKIAKINTALITDAGMTCVAPGTITCLAIGPENEDRIDTVTGSLKMM